jgi:DUF4097 and DUF4098 domain-containing protein YvlB
MNSFQRLIKYCAIAFAILLAIGIISFMVNVALTVVSFASGNGFHSGRISRKNSIEFTSKDIDTIDFDETFTGVTGLDIDNSAGNLEIVAGDSFRVEGTNVFEGFEAKKNDNGTLVVSDNESGFHFFGIRFNGFNSPNSKITVTVPADFVAEEVRIETGAGTVTLEELTTEYLYISAGAGNIKGSDLIADKVKLEGGVGSIDMENVTFKNASFECGVGNVSLSGVLLEENKFDCGVGEVILELQGKLSDYDLDIESGVGNIRVNGEKIEEIEHTNRFADHSIEVDGGVGGVRINIE